MRITRRRFLSAIGAGGTVALGVDGFLIEPNRVTVTRHSLGEPALPGTRNIRIVQLTDLHLQEVDDHAERIAQETNRLAADLILITGDSIDRPNRLGELSAFCGLLELSTPKYAILGNWEYGCGVSLPALAKVYEGRNCRLLVNETVAHRVGNSSLVLTGMDDLVGGRPDIGRALAQAPTGDGHLLMVHCPAYRDELQAVLRQARLPANAAPNRLDSPAELQSLATVDFVLSGHTHGGQVTLFGFAPITPGGSGAYVSGWYSEGGLPLYVSRGLGTTTIPARFCAPPEIAVFDWTLGTS